FSKREWNQRVKGIGLTKSERATNIVMTQMLLRGEIKYDELNAINYFVLKGTTPRQERDEQIALLKKRGASQGEIEMNRREFQRYIDAKEKVDIEVKKYLEHKEKAQEERREKIMQNVRVTQHYRKTRGKPSRVREHTRKKPTKKRRR
ncbi:MAG: hypothetical protein GWN31_07535, partial [Candidatus Thorarchaeota archaeon]|nr:hypothetical protein [Candidatus Thorarchaeota archaeon]